MNKCITLLNIYFFINEQIELFEYTFLRNKAREASKGELQMKREFWMKRMREWLKYSSISIQIKENYIF